MAKIKEIQAQEIFNPQGCATVQTSVVLEDGTSAVASVPSGDLDSKYAAVNLVDNEQSHFQGQGVLKAVANVVNIIAPRLVGYEASRQQEIDKLMIELDGTQNKGILGANAMLSVSMAVAKAAAKSSGVPLYLYLRQFVKRENSQTKLPTPIISLINGGRRAENLLDFRDFFIIPGSFKTFEESLQIAFALQSSLRTILKVNNLLPLFSIEGGYALPLANNAEAFSLLSQALEAINIRLGYDVFFGIDANADAFYANGDYRIKDRSMSMSSDDLISFYANLISAYHILYIEDPLAVDDWSGWEKIAKQVSQETIIIGDLLTATNPYRLQMALARKAVSGITIKPIQIGTVMESLAVMEIARISGLKIVVSHQSGSSMDDFLADFAVAVSADYVNFGPLTRGEYMVKYNRMLEIEKQLKKT
jgi:enolase